VGIAGGYWHSLALKTVAPPPMEAAMKFTPQALNLCSKGRWVKAHIVLPDGYIAADVDTEAGATLKLLGVEVASERMKVSGNKKGRGKVKITFDRSGLCGALADGDFAEVTVTGSLTTGEQFYGTDTVEIIRAYPNNRVVIRPSEKLEKPKLRSGRF
jgi:hypothetical protein